MTAAAPETPATPGALRALERLGKTMDDVLAAEVHDYAVWACRMEATMPGQTGVFSAASADAMELYDLLNVQMEAAR